MKTWSGVSFDRQPQVCSLRVAAPVLVLQLIRVRGAAEIALLMLAFPLSPSRQCCCDRLKSGVEEVLALKAYIEFSFLSQVLSPQKKLEILTG